MEEKKLVQKLNRRSRGALEQAIGAFTPYVNTVVWRVLGEGASREDMEEAVSDVFLALWTHAGKLDPERGLRPWLGAVARNKATDLLRRRPPPLPLDEDLSTPGPDGEAERHSDAQRLWQAVESLGEPDAALFVRHYYYGEKLADIAAALGLSLGNVKVRLSRGRKKLKQLLTEGGDAL